MTAKIIINIASIIGLSLFQVAFISGLGAAGSLNLALVVLIFILGFSGLNLALWWAAGLGFVLEIFSFLPFGAFLLSLSLTVFAADILLNYFFTNRSLYSFLALAALSTVIYELAIGAISLIYNWQAALGQIAANLIFTFLIFYVVHFLGRNFKPEFLIKKS